MEKLCRHQIFRMTGIVLSLLRVGKVEIFEDFEA